MPKCFVTPLSAVRLPAGVGLAAPHRLAGGRLLDVSAWQLRSLRSPIPIPPASLRGAQPTVSEYGLTSWHCPVFTTSACMPGGIEARMLDRISSCMPRSRADVVLVRAACSCRAQPRGISPAPDGCAASTTSLVSASSKRRSRSSQLSVLPNLLGLPVRTRPAPSAGRPLAPSSMKTWRYSCGATSILFSAPFKPH